MPSETFKPGESGCLRNPTPPSPPPFNTWFIGLHARLVIACVLSVTLWCLVFWATAE